MTKKELKLNTNHRLREIRESLGLTQQNLADLLGTSQSQIFKLETGLRTLDIVWIDRFARALQIAPWMLIADPKTILDERDRELLSRYRALPENLRAAVDSILFADASAPLPSPRGGEGAGRKSGG